MSTFSIDNWKALDDREKAKHTLSKCDACFTTHESLQRSFPGKPMYTTPSTIVVHLPQTPNGGFTKRQEKDISRQVLQDLDNVWQKEFGKKITPSLPKILPEANLATKVTKTERKKINRVKKREIVKEINTHFAKNATLTVLASLSSYKRKSLALSFETPPHPKRQK